MAEEEQESKDHGSLWRNDKSRWRDDDSLTNGGQGGRKQKAFGACQQPFRPALLRVPVACGAAAASVRGRHCRAATAAALAATGAAAAGTSGGAGTPAQVAPHAGNSGGLQAMQAGFPARPGAGRLV